MTAPVLKFSPAQLRSFRDSNGTFNLWHGPVRSGKSFISIIRWIRYVALNSPPGPLFAFGRTLSAVKRNVVTPMFELLGDEIVGELNLNQTVRV